MNLDCQEIVEFSKTKSANVIVIKLSVMSGLLHEFVLYCQKTDVISVEMSFKSLMLKTSNWQKARR